MKTEHAYEVFLKIQGYYNSIPLPRYRHVNIKTMKEKFQKLQHLKDNLGQNKAYQNLINAMSQIISRVEKQQLLAKVTMLRATL